jgi:DNA repair photolyase
MLNDFEDIEVKRDAPLILEEQLRRKRKPCMIGTGAMCDPYIPLEDELQVTRECLKLIERYGFGLAIQTKSTRILRDIDLLRAINENAKCVVQMTLTTYDERLCEKLEPNVSTTAERVRALEIMRGNGIPTVVWMSPILPFINDTEENMRGLLGYCVDAGVRAIMFFGFGMTLRAGSRDYYYRCLDSLFPGVKRRYIETFGDAYECPSPNNDRLTAIFTSECDRRGILWKPDDVFGYLREFEVKTGQASLFQA